MTALDRAHARAQLRIRLRAYLEALERSTTGRGPQIKRRRRELRRLAAVAGEAPQLELVLAVVHEADDRRRTEAGHRLLA